MKSISQHLAKAIPATIICIILTACGAGGNNRTSVESSSANDSLMTVLKNNQEFDKLEKSVDSLQAAGAMSVWKAAEYRTQVFAHRDGDQMKLYNMLKEVMTHRDMKSIEDSVSYYSCAMQLVITLENIGRYEEEMSTASQVLKEMEPLKDHPKFGPKIRKCTNIIRKNLMLCQHNLRMNQEAQKNGEICYRDALELANIQNDWYYSYDAVDCLGSIADMHIDDKDYKDAETYLHLIDSIYTEMQKFPDAVPLYMDYIQYANSLRHAKVSLHLKRPAESAKYYEQYQATNFSRNLHAYAYSASYLIEAGRYQEAADLSPEINAFLASLGGGCSIGNLYLYSIKFLANYHAGRRDTALAVANYVFENLDSAITAERQSNAIEMATVYETQKKDAEIAQQQIELTQQRVIGLIIAIVLLTVFFIIYTMVRRRAAKRLADMKAAQERIESELRIARDIQMSMVPSIFPEREGLDMFAQMTPAKEVGGDLYGYLLQDDKLYFAVGDVSGKGVPASLFMAQATRLFLTLAKQGMMPAEICTRMNDALSGDDNESGMFVTFWLGLLDLETGHLDFCNAGHNAPVIGGGDSKGEFLEMQPNAPIGLFPGLEYEGEEIETVKGRALFIYTDGLNEAENQQQGQFGDERLLDILKNTHFDSAQQVIESLKAEVEQHRNGAEPNDDLTMMCLRVS